MFGNDIRVLRIKIFDENMVLFSIKEEYMVKEKTKYYTTPIKLEAPTKSIDTKVFVIAEDCLVTAEMLVKLGYKTAVLNMASAEVPGGAVIHGTGAQEENLCRRTNLYPALTQDKKAYPMQGDSAGSYAPKVLVFRQGENTSYDFLPRPFTVSVISVSALIMPKTDLANNLNEEDCLHTKERIRTILRIGAENGQEALVLSAFGCGVFLNPPQQMATLFKEVIEEYEFKNRFKIIVFSILNDSNAPKGGNYKPFATVLN